MVQIRQRGHRSTLKFIDMVLVADQRSKLTTVINHSIRRDFHHRRRVVPLSSFLLYGTRYLL